MKGEIKVKKPTGYKAISVIKLLNGVGAYTSGKLSYKALRVYMACYELEAIREAAKRSSKLKSGRSHDWVCYERKELIKLTGGLTLRSIGKSLKELESASVMKFSKDNITFTETPTPDSKQLLENALSGRKGGRGGTRVIPVPRRMLKMLASMNKPSLFLTIIAYMIRGLSIQRSSIKRNTGASSINNKGTVKASWIAEVFCISLRAAKSARAQMIELGLIERDTGSYQRKLNRDGSYFQLNLNWFKALSESKIAPPRAKNRTKSAPPYKKLKTSKEIKNQKTSAISSNNALRAKSGFSIEKFCKKGSFNRKINKQTSDKNKLKHTKKIRKPNLRDIQIEDLKRVSSVLSLYEQAILAGWLQKSRANQLNCVAAALRASTVNAKNPAGVFIKIIKNKLWNHITQAQEGRAVIALKRYEKRDISLIKNYQIKDKEPLSFYKDKAFTGLKTQTVSNTQKELQSMILGILEKTQVKAVA